MTKKDNKTILIISEDDTIIENYTILEGYDQEYKVCDEDTVTSIVYNIVEQKKLPRTGF